MTEIDITDKIYQTGDDIGWAKSWERVVGELIESVGPFVSRGEHPNLLYGDGWAIVSGFPREHQEFCLIIDDDKLACNYILKYMGVK